MIVEAFLFVLTLFLISQLLKRRGNTPPGPWSLPVFGHVPVMHPAKAKKMHEKYGDVFMTRLGAVNFIYIANYKTAKEAYSSIEFADRPNWEVFRILDDEKQNKSVGGIIQNNGQNWHHNRRFFLRHLRDLGMGKSKLEGAILTEVENLVEDFKLLTKQPSKMPFSINICVLNIIWQLIASHRYDFYDKNVEELMKKINEIQEVFLFLSIPIFFPFLKTIFPKKLLDSILRSKRIAITINEYVNIVRPFIENHMENLDENNPSDLIDEYLCEMKSKTSDEFSHFTMDDLFRSTFDLFFAGNDTTATMTRWILLYMAKFPHIQQKIQDEIDKIVPSDSLPGLHHRNDLAYLDATINEVQRLSSMLPFGVFRATAADVTLNGYAIPKDSVVFSLAEITHKDPNLWSNPDDFDPSRFLDSDGKFIAHQEGFQPFGLGKRQCLGEQFARMELYLITAALLQKFTFSAPEGQEIDIEPITIPMMNRPKDDQLLSIKIRTE